MFIKLNNKEILYILHIFHTYIYIDVYRHEVKTNRKVCFWRTWHQSALEIIVSQISRLFFLFLFLNKWKTIYKMKTSFYFLFINLWEKMKHVWKNLRLISNLQCFFIGKVKFVNRNDRTFALESIYNLWRK